jgi:hypothetical protein
VLISAEPICRHIDKTLEGDWKDHRRGYLRKLAGLLSPFDVTALIVLRRQDDFIRSLYQEHVMNGTRNASKSFREFREQHLKTLLRFKDNLDLFQECFPCLEVMVYEDLRANSGLIPGFFAPLGVDTSSMTDVGVIRRSLTVGETLLKQRLNPIVDSKRTNKELLAWLRSDAVQLSLSRHFGEGKHELWESFEARTQFLSLFDEENETIRRTYFPEKSRLFPPLENREAFYAASLPDQLVYEIDPPRIATINPVTFTTLLQPT